jgi:hypothetical protein
MKTRLINRLLLSGFLVAGWTGSNAQSTLDAEVPGDNFSLEGALELFKKSGSPEEFERRLNSTDSRVNNLDLNGDNRIDYIRVIDYTERNVHAFILQAVLSDTESQDVAVIELEKLGDGKAVLQITGDADVYGIETIIEPTEEVRINAGTSTTRTVVNVWAWPSVQYVYGPHYSVWVSPWHWTYRPIWWSPWRPVAYYVYDPWWRPYRPYYASCHSHRVHYAPVIYRPYRTTSVIVYHNYRNQIDGYRSRNGYRADGRNHYGSNGHSRSDYHRRDNHNDGRHSADAISSRNHYRSTDASRSTQADRSTEASRSGSQTRKLTSYSRPASGRSYESSSAVKTSRGYASPNTNVQGTRTRQTSQGSVQSIRKPSSAVNTRTHGQRSPVAQTMRKTPERHSAPSGPRTKSSSGGAGHNQKRGR